MNKFREWTFPYAFTKFIVMIFYWLRLIFVKMCKRDYCRGENFMVVNNSFKYFRKKNLLNCIKGALPMLSLPLQFKHTKVPFCVLFYDWRVTSESGCASDYDRHLPDRKVHIGTSQKTSDRRIQLELFKRIFKKFNFEVDPHDSPFWCWNMLMHRSPCETTL